MQGNSRPSLKECLDFLTSDGSPHLQENADVDYIILRRVKTRKEYVYVEFVDGDGKDEKEWFEGPDPELTTVKTLFGMRDETSRGERREVYGRKKLGDEVDYDVLLGKKCESAESPKSSDGEEMVVMDAVKTGSANGDSSKGADKYVPGESSCAGPRKSAGTEQRASCALSEKGTKARPDARKGTLRAVEAKKVKTSNKVRKTEVDEMDAPNRKTRRIESRSATKKGE
jgi:hypothetical protein